MITEKEIYEQFPITGKVIMEENKNYTEVTQANFHRRQGALWLLDKISSQLDTGVMPNEVIAGKELYKYISKKIGECDTAMKKNKEQNTPIQKVEYADNRSMQIAYEDIFKRIKSQREA